MQLEFPLVEDRSRTAKAPGTLRPGGRTARTREAVLRAVIDELSDRGYAGATVERVAERADVAKTTIYRRWGSIDGLLADFMADRAARDIPVPDEGDLGADLRALARDVVGSLSHPAVKAALGAMVTEATGNPAARTVLAGFLGNRLATMAVIVERAVARGELPPGTDAAGVIGTVTAVIYYRLYVLAEEATQHVADSAAATAVAAARAGVHSAPPPA
jgi:AcrR family transcriptional regulator